MKLYSGPLSLFTATRVRRTRAASVAHEAAGLAAAQEQLSA
jgi:hypothetical protein